MAQSQEKPDVEQGGLERKMETRHLTMIQDFAKNLIQI